MEIYLFFASRKIYYSNTDRLAEHIRTPPLVYNSLNSVALHGRFRFYSLCVQQKLIQRKKKDRKEEPEQPELDLSINLFVTDECECARSSRR